MKRLNRAKLIQLRDNIQVYLDKIEREDKVANLDKTIIQGTTEVVNGFYDAISRKLDDVKTAPLVGSNEIVEAINGLKNGFSIPAPIDRTDEIVKAISDIRFPEVNFPNTISVDNFPPQRIPQPVTNIKSTLVADDTGLLQNIIDAIGGINSNLYNAYGELLALVPTTETVAATYVPSSAFQLKGVYGTGLNDGLFNLYIDGVRMWQGRNAWTDRNVKGTLELNVPAGKAVELKIINLKPLASDYSGGFYGYLS
jgi:hypothetical protein